MAVHGLVKPGVPPGGGAVLGSYQLNDARRSSQASSLVTLWAAPPEKDDARQSQVASAIHLFSVSTSSRRTQSQILD